MLFNTFNVWNFCQIQYWISRFFQTTIEDWKLLKTKLHFRGIFYSYCFFFTICSWMVSFCVESKARQQSGVDQAEDVNLVIGFDVAARSMDTFIIGKLVFLHHHTVHKCLFGSLVLWALRKLSIWCSINTKSMLSLTISHFL